MAEANRKAAQLTTEEKSTGLSLSVDNKECPGAVAQEGRKQGMWDSVVMGKEQALQPGALPTGHSGTMLKGRSRHPHPAGSH